MKALVTGVTGQTGSYLVEYLLEKGYEVVGLDRRKSSPNDQNISHLRGEMEIVVGDLNDRSSIDKLVRREFDEIYNLAAQSHVHVSFEQPEYTFHVNALGVLNLLESIRLNSPYSRFYQASTSEMFGGLTGDRNSEDTPFHPRSPYGVSKLAAHWLVINYRESYMLRCCCGILHNHESPRRGGNFVTKKICDWVNRVKAKSGISSRPFKEGDFLPSLKLGNLEARRDWGHARDYAKGIHLILNQNGVPMRDYVLGMGETRSVKEFVEIALLKGLGARITWARENDYEVGYLRGTDWKLIESVKEFYRPSEVHTLIADSSRARKELGWVPEYTFEALVEDMLNG